MKIWWVLSGANYYPDWDNFVASFETREEADEFVANHKNEWKRRDDWYEIINISDRL